MTRYISCIPDRVNFKRFLLREDFCAIVGGDIASAAALRVAEMKTNEIIDQFRREYHRSDMPPEDWRWFDLTLREVEATTLGLRGKSSYAYALGPESKERHSPSLIQLGFLHCRYIARADGKLQRVATQIHRDRHGKYVHVLDLQGFYEGVDGQIHDATEEGFSLIKRQYLLDMDCVNVAIDALDDAE